MTQNKYTPEGMPVIRQAVFETVERDFVRTVKETKGNPLAFYRNILAHMKEHNKDLHRIFWNTHNELSHNVGECAAHYFGKGLLHMYDLYRRQAESIQLEDDFMAKPTAKINQ